jgi:RimJ/RimL family protein N-acetyltransferase
MTLRFGRLADVPIAAIIALHNDPRVRRHLPLSTGDADEARWRAWVVAKEQEWQRHGRGPWACFDGGAFIGWGGLQDEAGDADVALVLDPAAWGHGATLLRMILARARDEFRLTSVTLHLPPSRARNGALARFGFVAEGDVWLAGVCFTRYRCHLLP